MPGRGRFLREANFPEMNASYPLGWEPKCVHHPCLAKGRWHGLLCLLMGDRVCFLGVLQETGSLASAYTGRWARAIHWDFPARVPRNSGCSAEKCRLFW